MKKKIKDLPKDFDLTGSKLKGKYIVSGWCKGFWVKKKLSDIEVIPITFESYNEIKNWTVEIPNEKRA